jgi:aminoglycoside N3'-acetyltransferase
VGSNHDNVTFLHHAEPIVDIPDKRIAQFRVPVAEDGVRVWRDMGEVDSRAGAHANCPADVFARIVDAHLAATGNRGGRVGTAACHFPARGLLAFALDVMRRVAAPAGAADRLPVASP